jgi:hypothetical protein
VFYHQNDNIWLENLLILNILVVCTVLFKTIFVRFNLMFAFFRSCSSEISFGFISIRRFLQVSSWSEIQRCFGWRTSSKKKRRILEAMQMWLFPIQQLNKRQVIKKYIIFICKRKFSLFLMICIFPIMLFSEIVFISCISSFFVSDEHFFI